jgi:membrane protease YdiL (CAAX protease family)
MDPDTRVRWGLGDAVVGLVGSFLASNIVYAAVAPPNRNETVGFGGFAVVQVVLWLGLIGAVVYASTAKGTGSLRRDFGLTFRLPYDALVGLGIGVLAQLLVGLMYLPFRHLIHEDLDKTAQDLAKHTSAGTFVVLVLMLAVIAPLVEELFFRGLLLRAFQRRLDDRWAIGLSAVIFAAFHFEVVQFPALFLVGVLLGILAVRTGRLGPGIFVHIAFNAAVVVFLRPG